jgi:hypothetical protein
VAKATDYALDGDVTRLFCTPAAGSTAPNGRNSLSPA